MNFSAVVVLYNIRDNTYTNMVIKSTEDIINIIGDGVKSNVCQVNIDKYRKVYYNSNQENLTNGVSGWIKLESRYSSIDNCWHPCDDKSFFLGDSLLLVLCDNDKPIDMDDVSLDSIISLITC